MSSPSSVQIIASSGNRIKFEVEMELTGSLLDMESTILSVSNPLGCCATAQALHRFDTDASPIEVGGIKLTSRTQSNKTYYSPYGPVDVVRPVYQTSRGGGSYLLSIGSLSTGHPKRNPAHGQVIIKPIGSAERQ